MTYEPVAIENFFPGTYVCMYLSSVLHHGGLEVRILPHCGKVSVGSPASAASLLHSNPTSKNMLPLCIIWGEESLPPFSTSHEGIELLQGHIETPVLQESMGTH